MEAMSVSELVVMKVIWSREEELVLHQIVALVNQTYGRDWNQNTVSTFLSRLVRKGYVTSYKKGRYYFYHVVVTEDQYRAILTSDQINFWSNGDVAGYICKVLDSQRPTKEDIEQIQEKILELQQKKKEENR